jgi:predicted nucleotidyltransferase
MEAAETTLDRYRRALDSVVEQLKRDPYVLAAILVGSLSYDTVWERSDIDLFLVTDEAKLKSESLTLVEDDIIVHAYPQTRSNFRKAIQGATRSSFLDSILARGTVLFSRDETIPALLASRGAMGARDQAAQILHRAAGILPLLTKAQKFHKVKGDLHYAFLWVMTLLPSLAAVETLRHGEVTSREVIQQAERYNPILFDRLYHGLIDGPKTTETIGAAIEAVRDYLHEHLELIFGSVFEYLAEQPGARSATEIDHHFESHYNVACVSMVCEWLADEGLIDRVAVPTRVTERSRADVQEAAYYFLRADP